MGSIKKPLEIALLYKYKNKNMIYSNKQAKKLKRPMTIDLKAMMAEDYLYSKKTLMEGIKGMTFKGLGTAGIIWFIIVTLYGWDVITPNKAKAEYKPKITYGKLLQNSDFAKAPPFNLYSRLKDECYRQNTRDKWHCIKTGLSIAYAESSWQDNHTPFGLQSREKGFRKWVSSYNKYWYKSQNGFFFYGDWGEYGRSHYCTSEDSSGSSKGCPNGRRNFDIIYSQLKIK